MKPEITGDNTVGRGCGHCYPERYRSGEGFVPCAQHEKGPGRGAVRQARAPEVTTPARLWEMLCDGSVSPDERAPGLDAGLHPSHAMHSGGFCVNCGAAVKGGNLAAVCTRRGWCPRNPPCGLIGEHVPDECFTAVERDVRELAQQLRTVFNDGTVMPWTSAPSIIQESWLAVARRVLADVHVGATAGDQAKDAEIQALRKALADESAMGDRIADRLDEGMVILRDWLNFDTETLRILGARDGESTHATAERVVNEREAFRMRAVVSDGHAAEANTRDAEARYMLDGARKKLAQVERKLAEATTQYNVSELAHVGNVLGATTYEPALTAAHRVVAERDGAREAWAAVVAELAAVKRERDDARKKLAQLTHAWIRSFTRLAALEPLRKLVRAALGGGGVS